MLVTGNSEESDAADESLKKTSNDALPKMQSPKPKIPTKKMIK